MKSIPCISMFAVCILSVASHWAQAEGLPAGWENMSAEQFLEAVNAKMYSEAPRADRQLLAAHAWNQFLNNPSFIATGDGKIVLEMVNRYAREAKLAAVEDASIEALRDRVAARLAAEPQLVTGATHNELMRTTGELSRIGLKREARAKLFIDWMAANDWRALPFPDLHMLCHLVGGKDMINAGHFSARWTGSLMAPVTGSYTFRQARGHRRTDTRLQVSINGQVVLDSSQSPSNEAGFTSSPVQLMAGQAVPIEANMVYDVSGGKTSRAPMVLLTWQREGSDETLIPTSAFAPPPGFAQPGAHGLKGEYFKTTTFEDLLLTRLDPGIDRSWSKPPLVSNHPDEAQEILAVCIAKLLAGEELSEYVAKNNRKPMEMDVWQIASRMTATELQQLVNMLRQHPQVLASASPAAIARLMRFIYRLPSNDQIALVGEWSLAHSLPKLVAGRFPDSGAKSYEVLNIESRKRIGLYWQDAYWNDAEQLCDLYLERPNGECNVGIAYAMTGACRHNSEREAMLLDRLTARIEDPSMQGDRLVTWLLARAMVTDIFQPRIDPLAGFSDLDSAYVAAESVDYKYWVLREMVARLSSVNQGARAKQLVEENRGRFAAPEHQAKLTEWVEKADALSAFYAQRRLHNNQAAQTAHLDELKRRRDKASQRGDANAASRYSELIGALENQAQ